MPPKISEQSGATASPDDATTSLNATETQGTQPEVDSENEADEPTADVAAGAGSASSSKKKKKKKSKKNNNAGDSEAQAAAKLALDKIPADQLKEFLALNPALARELPAESSDIANALRKLDLSQIMTGLAASGKNVKDMGSYKFWNTQPVPKFGEEGNLEDGPLKIQTVEDVPKEPLPMVDGFEWVTVDITQEDQLTEVHELLKGHYVEDSESMLRFNYSRGFLRWALMPPGWKSVWHTGVRTTTSKKLVAFISAVPVTIQIRGNSFRASDVNFLVVHKKLRNKRLTPVLIKEITRRSNVEEIWQGLYTAGIVLPKPVSTCRYFHRSLNWQKLYEVGFSPLPSGSKPQYQVRKYALPESPNMKGFREMRVSDRPAVHDLLQRYLKRFEFRQGFNEEEFSHWFHVYDPDGSDEQFLWIYVVEDDNGKITDMVSFYSLDSTVLDNPKHQNIRAAYLFYYATEAGLTEPVDRDALQTRLNTLMHNGLIMAKRNKFDVFNALSLMDNALFLDQQKFGPGDGQLHYYLFNYRASPVSGGVNSKNQLDTENLSGVGVVML